MNLGFVSADMELTDLPPEVLEMIFSYLQLNLQGLLELSMVCRVFRDVARRVPVPVKIPLQDSQLAVMQVISFFKCYLERWQFLDGQNSQNTEFFKRNKKTVRVPY